ncbi:flagellar filament capping protein FliD [Sedimentibacter hydroxybenzoicus DSM 7310]|uniref:Flagellar hook-associated protein 2 n=1 Tax=Sedimentibacter hydroxybenzoicus DSM 7310 TaxID=1123245 RepID=A0A974BGU8_SEDHY|nr:flagellar filament capping protein FliD [Sedimentibacter hydroxybenzoicus]NYB72626.1 flagellar filament capping protein FliD [Sedimentibacter hydroxybenzoicus DSM 7310]
MASISNSIYGTTINKGFGGLMSGLDTDELVKQMTAATRNKINRQYQSKQKLLYRQEAYREVSSKLLAFSDKYFSYSTGSKTNILSASFFEAHTFKPSSNYVNVTGNAENIKNFSIDSITSVASAATLVSSHRVSSNVIESDSIGEYISPLAGETFSVRYNDKTYNLKIDADFEGDTFAKVVNQLNKQLAKIDDIPSELKFSFERNPEKGNQAKIMLTDGAYISSASKDFLDVLNFKVGSEEGGSSTEYIVRSELTKSAESILSDANSYITFDYNGVKKQINLDGEITDPSELAAYLQDELNKLYGDNKITVDENDGKLTFTVEGETNLLSINSISSDLSQLTGLKSGNSNRLNMNATLENSGIAGLTQDADGKYSITINNTTLSFEKDKTLNDVIKAINSNADMKINISYSSISDSFSIKADETGSHIGIDIKDDGAGSLSRALFGESSKWTSTEGTDTVISYTLNGKEIKDFTRSTANISIDGINIELNKNAEGLNDITFDVTNNVDEVVEKVKKFIDDYNEIITLIGTKTKEKPNSKYPPLTPEQQDEMTEKEIENWNKEAQKGVLFGDSKMTSVLSDFRMSMMGKTDVSDFVLANIGISPAFMDTSGKLVLDEEKFKEALMENPDEIAGLFTGTKEGGTPGLAVQLKEVLTKNIGAFGTSGILIEEAGLDSGRTSDQNNISEKIKDYDKRMEALKKALEVERQRYWNQFTALEKALSNLNAQSSWLTDMMG